MKNLFKHIPTDLPEELNETLVQGQGNFRIERIVSRGHHSPPDFWYDQQAAEWVVLLRGSAVLEFDDQPETVEMKTGDWIEISPRRRHRIVSTSPDEDTVWLAVHWG